MATILETINQVLNYENEPQRRRELLKNSFELTEEQVNALMQAIESIPEDYTQLVAVVEGLVGSYGALENTVEDLSGDVDDLKADFTQLDETAARIDGSYEQMTVGNAEQLVSSKYTEDTTPYLYRTSGGSADIGNREEDVIVGGSVGWNQLVQNGDFSDGTTGWSATGGTISASNNVLSYEITTLGGGTVQNRIGRNFSLISGHKYLASIQWKPSKAYALAFRFNQSNVERYSAVMTSGVWNTVGFILPCTVESETLFIGFNTSQGGSEVGDVEQARNAQLFDLTAMFNSTIADLAYSKEQSSAGSGIAWLKSSGFFNKNFYPYNPGGMESVHGLLAHEMVGFNQWDGNYTSGKWINDFDGSITNANGYNITDYIPVIPNNVYYHSVAGSSRSLYYDADKEVINTGAWAVGDSAGTFTIPSNARYIRFTLTDANISTFILNLHWSGYLDGTYQPYVKHSYPLDSTLMLRGIPKVNASGELYYDGDIYRPDGTVERRYAEVDLGTLNWTASSSSNCFYASAPAYGAGLNTGMICEKYVFTGIKSSSPYFGDDKTIQAYLRPDASAGASELYIHDSAYTDAATFKAAMSGVMLVYELANPITASALPYASPQIVYDFGTEEYVIDSDVTVPVPVGHDTKYLDNLRDKLQHLPDLASSDGYYLINQTDNEMSLEQFRIPKAPTANGTYVLKATVSGGTPTYTWEAQE